MALNKRPKILSVFGTRPEAIKMAPVVKALAAHQDGQAFESLVCVTGQHRHLLDQVLQLFEIVPQADLNIMKPNQDLTQITTAVLLGMKDALADLQPDMVLVHGDTTTAMAATLAAFYARVPVGHVEAGLRTFNLAYPFPEEMNRLVVDQLATLCFAPTPQPREFLLQSGIPADRIHVTGNTVIDALLYTLAHSRAKLPVALEPGQRMLLVTAHRRENFGAPLLEICAGLKALVEKFEDVVLVYPVHPNPNVKGPVEQHLGGHPRIHLIEPQEYEPFCKLMDASTLILTDSGGVQEEAPSLGKPVLVLRDETERPEAVKLGLVDLVGPHTDRIVARASELLTDSVAYARMAAGKAAGGNPYGDGQASTRIAEILSGWFR